MDTDKRLSGGGEDASRRMVPPTEGGGGGREDAHVPTPRLAALSAGGSAVRSEDGEPRRGFKRSTAQPPKPDTPHHHFFIITLSGTEDYNVCFTTGRWTLKNERLPSSFHPPRTNVHPLLCACVCPSSAPAWCHTAPLVQSSILSTHGHPVHYTHTVR